jgi:hypothetical protein
LRKMVLPKWSAGAVGAGSVPGGAVRLGEGRVSSRDYVGRGKVPVAGERGVGVGRRLVGHRRAWRRRAWRRRAGRWRREGQQPPPWPAAGDGAPRYEFCGEVVAFRFLERAAEIHLWAPNPNHSTLRFQGCGIHHLFFAD